MRPRRRAGTRVCGVGGWAAVRVADGRWPLLTCHALALPHAVPEPLRQQLLSTAVAVGCSVLGAAAAFLLIRHAPSAALA